MRRSVATLLLLAACAGEKGFGGTFAGTYQGEPVLLVLEVTGAGATGTMEWGGVEAVVSGTVEGNRIRGSVRQPQMGVEVPFEGTLDGDTIEWTYTYVAAGQKVPLTLTRTKAAPGRVDPQLVGRWRLADGAATFVFNADGTFERGVAKGRWRCEGGFLHLRPQGGGWAVQGRYVLSGDELAIYDRTETRELWRKG
ncbi:MAG: hypothetical protein L6Q95_05005 [Planctomycetes bacterium]|nr:hypothetical protein [Planctomycetota bacterium]